MSTEYVIHGEKSLTAGGAIGQNIRVKFSGGKLAVAGLTDLGIGVALRAAFASGDVIPVRLNSAQGTTIFVASGAITQGNPVYSDANGKVAGTQGTNAVLLGYAMQTVSANGDQIEVLPL